MGQKRKKWINQDSDELFRTVLDIKDLDEARRFFRDLLTESEIIEFGQRFKVARFLYRGVPYREISRRTWMSPRTIARIQKWLQTGKGGYRAALERAYGHHPVSSGKRSAVV